MHLVGFTIQGIIIIAVAHLWKNTKTVGYLGYQYILIHGIPVHGIIDK